MARPPIPIIVLRNPPSLAMARVVSASISNPAPWQAITAGDVLPITLQITNGTGTLEDMTGRTYRVGLGNLNARVTGGMFTLSDSTDTTIELDWDATAAEIEYALNLLNDSTGPNGGLVTVEGGSGTPFVVIWASNGARALLTANITLLEPAATSVIATSQTGTGSVPAIQVVRLLQYPYALLNSLTVSTTTASGSLTVSSQGLFQFLAANPGAPLFFEIEETEGSNVTTILQAPVILNGTAIPRGTLQSPALTNFDIQGFSTAIPVDALTVDVTFSRAFASTPTAVVAIIAMPDDTGENIFATLIADSLTNTGCTFSLSGEPTASGYYIKGIAIL